MTIPKFQGFHYLDLKHILHMYDKLSSLTPKNNLATHFDQQSLMLHCFMVTSNVHKCEIIFTSLLGFIF